MFSQPVNVVFTENGSSLSETLNGQPIGNWVLQTPPGQEPIIWVNANTGLTPPGTLDTELQWYSPVAGLFNVVQTFTTVGDVSGSPPSPILANDTTYYYNTTYPVDVLYNGTYVPANITYNDINDVSAVPDASSTLSLCGFACLSVVVMRRYVTPHTVAA